MKNGKIGGLRSIVVFIPTIVIIGFLYIVILISTVITDNYTTKMYNETNKTNDCLDEITILQARSSLMTETATTFIYTPLKQMGPNININPSLGAYKEELEDETRKIDYILNELKKYKISDDDWEKINMCVNDVEQMFNLQIQAFTLISNMDEVKELGTDNALYSILAESPIYELTEEEKLLSSAELHNKAIEIILVDTEKHNYNSYKSELSKTMREISKSITDKSDKYQNDLLYKEKMFRGVLWLSILLILIINILLFFVLLKRLVLPINRYAKQLKDNEELDPKNSLYEARYLAIEYNKLLNKRKEFEKELRVVAEIDSLTQLPNRYCYNEYLKTASLDKESICVFLFDINNLKYINDTFGHAKGDELIKNASFCIKDCFLDENGRNCFRIGGDEFVAILDNIDENQVESYVRIFKELEKKYDVSIAMGYAYSNELSKIGYEKLIMIADDNMYKDKQRIKENEIQ